jgi:hypothetical protein
MILGMDLYTFTHVVISLVGIASGFVVLFAMLGGRNLPGWTALFLATNVLTSATGYGFHNDHVTPGQIVGALDLIALAVALYALYVRHLAGGWRTAYVVAAVIALYFNVFVLVVQAFAKVPALHALAPTGSENPFKLVQGVVLLLFLLAGWRATRTFRPAF